MVIFICEQINLPNFEMVVKEIFFALVIVKLSERIERNLEIDRNTDYIFRSSASL